MLDNVSIGIAPATALSDEPQELLRRADLALYEAKKAGKAGFEVFDEGDHALSGSARAGE